MIVRTWRGTVALADADAYADYMLETGVPGYAGTPGNRGVYMLRRTTDAGCEFLMVSLWDSMDAIRAFAGHDVDTAVFYPQDDRYLVDRDLHVHHYEVVARAGDVAAPGGEVTRPLREDAGPSGPDTDASSDPVA